jgi:hypothetical protein
LKKRDFAGIVTLKLKLRPWSANYTNLTITIDNSICVYGTTTGGGGHHSNSASFLGAIMNN